MKIHEYQAKEYLRRFRIPVPEGHVVDNSLEARDATKELGGSAVIKAQVHAGGRGQAGGVKVVSSPDEALEVAERLLGGNLVTQQTGILGVPVNWILVESVAEITRELYLSVLVDGAEGRVVLVASAAGGMEIEKMAEETPEKILRVPIDPAVGVQPYQARSLAYGLDLSPELVRPFTELVGGLYKAFLEGDCSLIEINPLGVTASGTLLCVDAKITFEDDALFRHVDFPEWRDPRQEDPRELQAAEYGIQYIQLDGDVGCLVNGAGLAMATMDTTRAAGSSPANFLDVGGSADETKVARAFKLIVSDPRVRCVLVNIFGGILRCDVAARGIVEAGKEAGVTVPIVVRLLGTNAEEGRAILQESGLPVRFAQDLDEASGMIAGEN